MHSRWIFRNGLLVVFAIVLAAPAHADGPGPDLKLLADKTFNSPEDTLRVEQYAKDAGEDGFSYQFWVFDKNQNAPS